MDAKLPPAGSSFLPGVAGGVHAHPPANTSDASGVVQTQKGESKGRTFGSLTAKLGNTAKKTISAFRSVFTSSPKAMPGGLPSEASDRFAAAADTKKEVDKLERKFKDLSKKKDSLPLDKLSARANALSSEISGLKDRHAKLVNCLSAQDEISWVKEAITRGEGLLSEVNTIKTDVEIKALLGNYKQQFKSLSKRPADEVKQQFQDTAKSFRSALEKYPTASISHDRELKQIDRIMFKFESNIARGARREVRKLESLVSELESKAAAMPPGELAADCKKLTVKIQSIKEQHGALVDNLFSKKGADRMTAFVNSEKMLTQRLTQLTPSQTVKQALEVDAKNDKVKNVARQITGEMLSTETAFRTSLELLISGGEKSPLGLLVQHQLVTDDDREAIKSYRKAVEGLAKESRAMEAKFKEGSEAISAGNYAKGMQKILEGYAASDRYINRCAECTRLQPSMTSIIEKLKKKDTKGLDAIQHRIFRDRQQGLSDIVIQPVQRLPRHKLLLGDLKKRGAIDSDIEKMIETTENRYSASLAAINYSVPK